MFTRPGLAFTGGPGVTDTDYILYITSQQTEQCLSGESVAYAASCLQDEHDFRSVSVYYMYICVCVCACVCACVRACVCMYEEEIDLFYIISSYTIDNCYNDLYIGPLLSN